MSFWQRRFREPAPRPLFEGYAGMTGRPATCLLAGSGARDPSRVPHARASLR
jgi:hypothetical protein